MKIVLTFVLNLLLVGVFAQSSTVKIGYTNADYIAMSHPDYKVIGKQLQEHQNKLQMLLQEKGMQLQQLEQEYQKLASTPGTDQFMIKDKEQQIINKQNEAQTFQANAEDQMMRKQQDLMVPLQKKISEAIEAVAKERGYTHVFNGESMLWMMDAKSFDITEDVLKKMGIVIPQQGAAGAGNAGGQTPPSILEVR